MMPVSRTANMNLDRAEVCGFLTDLANMNFSDEAALVNLRTKDGYVVAPGAKRKLTQYNITLKFPLYIERSVSLYSPQGRFLEKREIEDVGTVDVNLSLYAFLSLKLADPANQKKVTDAFNNTVLNLKDIDVAETDILRTGISIDEYWVDLTMELDKLHTVAPSDFYQEYVAKMRTFKDTKGKPLYDVRPEDTVKYRCKPTRPNIPDDGIITNDPNDDRGIGDKIKDKVRQEDEACQDVQVLVHHICTIGKLVETKMEWERQVVWGCIETDVPVFFYRQTTYELVSVCTGPSDQWQAIEPQIYDCITDAALDAILFNLITGGGGFPAALSVFMASVTNCIENKLRNRIKCVVPDLKVVTLTPEWQRV